MDWYSWLLKSSKLDGNVAYEYSLLLSNNELEEEDIAHFNHDFLLTMGIQIAKHRLEILKLAKKKLRPASALFTILHKARQCLTRHVHDLVRHESKEIAILPNMETGGRRTVRNLMTKNGKLAKTKKGILHMRGAVCNGVKPVQLGRSPSEPGLSPLILLGSSEKGRDPDGFNWAVCKDTGQMRWDSMFQDMKPT